jgi:solute carrier family 25 phosphate transporter 3
LCLHIVTSNSLFINSSIFGIFVLSVSMIMFPTFEHSVDLLYQKIIQRRKEDCSRAQQLGVTCLAGYTAGAVGTVISNPADNIVSCLYNKQAQNVMQVEPVN